MWGAWMDLRSCLVPAVKMPQPLDARHAPAAAPRRQPCQHQRRPEVVAEELHLKEGHILKPYSIQHFNKSKPHAFRSIHGSNDFSLRANPTEARKSEPWTSAPIRGAPPEPLITASRFFSVPGSTRAYAVGCARDKINDIT